MVINHPKYRLFSGSNCELGGQSSCQITIVRHSVPWMKSPNHTKIPIFDGETCHNCTHGVLVSRFL